MPGCLYLKKEEIKKKKRKKRNSSYNVFQSPEQLHNPTCSRAKVLNGTMVLTGTATGFAGKVLLKIAAEPTLLWLSHTCFGAVHWCPGLVWTWFSSPAYQMLALVGEGLHVIPHIKLLRKVMLREELLLCFHYSVIATDICFCIVIPKTWKAVYTKTFAPLILIERCRAISGHRVRPAVLIAHLCSATGMFSH